MHTWLTSHTLHRLSTYAICLALLGGVAYWAYLTFVPQPKRKGTKKAEVSAPVGTVTATSAGGYQEEWIPEHHLRKAKGKKGDATSGDELEASGPETSGTEGKRRSTRRK